MEEHLIRELKVGDRVKVKDKIEEYMMPEMQKLLGRWQVVSFVRDDGHLSDGKLRFKVSNCDKSHLLLSDLNIEETNKSIIELSPDVKGVNKMPDL